MTWKQLVAAGTLGVATMAALPATAMPIDNLARAAPANIENVHWVCGPYRCWWRPNYYYYRPRVYFGPRFYVAPRYHRHHRIYRYRRW